MQDEYLFCNGIHACAIGGDYVLLDTALDRYLCLSGSQAAWFSDIAALPNGRLSGLASQFAERLCDKNILTRNNKLGQSIRLTSTCEATASIYDLDTGQRPAPSLTRIATLLALRATSGLARRVRGQRLAATLAAAHHWKEKARANASGPDTHALGLARCFHALTPYCLSIHDACFLRSMLLLQFLAHYGVEADWIFGVRLAPFSAHCWVSRNGIILNEERDTCADFQTIMVI
tara:strand:+ start:6288 stop:6986 length:699 start_codon:yes stop_codon:yes gene_type:complete